MLWYGYAALITLLSSEAALFMKFKPVLTWFYTIAWWSYIFLIDAVNYKIRNDSLFKSNRYHFFYICFISVFFWLIFEVCNFTLQNWFYKGLPVSTIERWAGYFLSYATVIPAIMETYDLFYHYNEKISFKMPRIKLSDNAMFLTGTVILGCVLLFPAIFFPLVWIAFIFIFEPLNKIAGKPLLNNSRKIVSLLGAGLVCGFLWEFWNFWAESKWVYQLPYLSKPKLFEMPVAGFLGFLPFALETYGFYVFSTYIFQNSLKSFYSRIIFSAVLIMFYLYSFYMIDLYTVLK